MIIPNTNRVLLRRLTDKDIESRILLSGQPKPGENLFMGEVVHQGDSKFRKGQIVYYSEYSAANIVDLGTVMRKERTIGEASKADSEMFIVGEDDIMAYEE